MDRLMKVTNQLLEALEAGRERFLQSEKPETDRAFFELVKQEADPIFELLDLWAEEASTQIRLQNIPLHPQQVESTKENLQSFIMHSFYKDIRKRKFMEIYKSCYYVFIRCKKENA